MSENWYFGSRGRMFGALLMCVLLASVYDRLGTLGWTSAGVPEQVRLKGVLYLWAAALGALIEPPVATMAVFSAMIYSAFAMAVVAAFEVSIAFVRSGHLLPHFVYAPLAYMIAVVLLTIMLLLQFAPSRRSPGSSPEPESLVERLAANPHVQLLAAVCSILSFVAIVLPQPFDYLQKLFAAI